ncbi:MAG: hypothetical protein DI570_06025 [Phenylobacterium zucineum]|nr:MAG: hypothetical protein DI570_06025 [Phenylobacterium zucineum]
MGPLVKDRATATAALEEALDLEKRGYRRVRVRDAKGATYDVKTFSRRLASGRIGAGTHPEV